MPSAHRKRLYAFLSFALALVLLLLIPPLLPSTAYADTVLPNSASYVQTGKTYFIRCHSCAGYLYAPSGSVQNSNVAIGGCLSANSRYQWKVIITSDGKFRITNVAYPSLCLQAGSTASSSLRLGSAGDTSNYGKWQLTIQTSQAAYFGTYKLTNIGMSGYSLMDTGNTTNRLQLGSFTTVSPIGSWIFEEVLATRNDAAPPISHNYTYGSNGYYYQHYARDVAPSIYAGNNSRAFPVYADKDGELTYWSSYVTENGQRQLTRIANFSVIKHTDSTTTVYAHLSNFANGYTAPSYPNHTSGSGALYEPHQISSTIQVTRGQVIGYVGATGSATGPHVHVEWYNCFNPIWGNALWEDYCNNTNYVADPKDKMKLWWS